MKATTTQSPADAERQLKKFIAKFEPRHQTLIRAVRKALRKRFPTAYELAYDNYNFFVIGYGSTERPGPTPRVQTSTSPQSLQAPNQFRELVAHRLIAHSV